MRNDGRENKKNANENGYDERLNENVIFIVSGKSGLQRPGLLLFKYYLVFKIVVTYS